MKKEKALAYGNFTIITDSDLLLIRTQHLHFKQNCSKYTLGTIEHLYRHFEAEILTGNHSQLIKHSNIIIAKPSFILAS